MGVGRFVGGSGAGCWVRVSAVAWVLCGVSSDYDSTMMPVFIPCPWTW